MPEIDPQFNPQEAAKWQPPVLPVETQQRIAELTPVQDMMQRVDALTPNVPGEPQSTATLYLGGSRKKQMVVSTSRYPNGTVGEVLFDYRDGKNSSVFHYEVVAGLMYATESNPKSLLDSVTQYPLDRERASAFLAGVIEHGSTEKPKHPVTRALGGKSLAKAA